MANSKSNYDKAEVYRRTKMETTYEYVPIIGEVLGIWRRIKQTMLGEEIHVELNHTIDAYDRIFLNGELIYTKKDNA